MRRARSLSVRGTGHSLALLSRMRLAAAMEVSSPLLYTGCPHCLRRFFHARTVTGREYHYPLCGLRRGRELPDISSRHLSLSAFRQVVAYLCTRLCSSQSQRESIWRMGIRLSRNCPRFRHTKENWARGFLSSHPVADGKA